MLRSMFPQAMGVAGVTAAMLAAFGCAPAATSGGFDSPNPSSRMYAIECAARDGDQASIRQIVEELDSDDPAVRMLAIEALNRLTGDTMGYRHFDPPELRNEAVERWVHAVETGAVGVATERGIRQ